VRPRYPGDRAPAGFTVSAGDKRNASIVLLRIVAAAFLNTAAADAADANTASAIGLILLVAVVARSPARPIMRIALAAVGIYGTSRSINGAGEVASAIRCGELPLRKSNLPSDG
jgi:hypothetical protein